MPVAVVLFAIVVMAFLVILGTVLYGILLAVIGWFGELWGGSEDIRTRVSHLARRTSVEGARGNAVLGPAPRAGDHSVFSADATYERIQGTRSTPRGRLRRRAPRP